MRENWPRSAAAPPARGVDPKGHTRSWQGGRERGQGVRSGWKAAPSLRPTGHRWLPAPAGLWGGADVPPGLPCLRARATGQAAGSTRAEAHLVTLTALTDVSDSGVSGAVRGRGCFPVSGPSGGMGAKDNSRWAPRPGVHTLWTCPGPSRPKPDSSSDARGQRRPHRSMPTACAHGPRDPASLIPRPLCRLQLWAGWACRASHGAPFSHVISVETPPPFPKNKLLSPSRNSRQQLSCEPRTVCYLMADGLASLQPGNCVRNKTRKRRGRG